MSIGCKKKFSYKLEFVLLETVLFTPTTQWPKVYYIAVTKCEFAVRCYL